jgi:hypothetical protein
MYVCMDMYIYVYIHTYIHTYTHTYIHTHTHTHIYIYIGISGPNAVVHVLVFTPHDPGTLIETL